MKCCRKCWTPYNCGNALCRCHPAPEVLYWENRESARARAESLAEDLSRVDEITETFLDPFGRTVPYKWRDPRKTSKVNPKQGV